MFTKNSIVPFNVLLIVISAFLLFFFSYNFGKHAALKANDIHQVQR